MRTSAEGFAAGSVLANSGTASRDLPIFAVMSSWGADSGLSVGAETSAATSETESRLTATMASQRGRDDAHRMETPLSGTLTGTDITTDSVKCWQEETGDPPTSPSLQGGSTGAEGSESSDCPESATDFPSPQGGGWGVGLRFAKRLPFPRIRSTVEASHEEAWRAPVDRYSRCGRGETVRAVFTHRDCWPAFHERRVAARHAGFPPAPGIAWGRERWLRTRRSRQRQRHAPERSTRAVCSTSQRRHNHARSVGDHVHARAERTARRQQRTHRTRSPAPSAESGSSFRNHPHRCRGCRQPDSLAPGRRNRLAPHAARQPRGAL